MKILLILSDGMRPDSLKGNKIIESLKQNSTYCMDAQTVMPSVTLPTHMSLFHSVDPSRHGTTTNTYAPQVHPVKGLFEVLKENNKKSAMFYDWESLRDLSRPETLTYSQMCSGTELGYVKTGRTLSESAIKFLNANEIDFAFLYLGLADMAGHENGWMSDEYLSAVNESCDRINEVINSLGGKYTIIITADHGGHDRIHGEDIKEDMTIPMFFCGEPFERNKEIHDVNIKDIAPTVAHLMGAVIPSEWDGRIIV